MPPEPMRPLTVLSLVAADGQAEIGDDVAVAGAAVHGGRGVGRQRHLHVALARSWASMP